MLDQVGEKFAAGVLHQEVETDARTDEHLFDPGDGPQLPQQHHIVGVIGVQVGTGLGGQTGPVFAHPVLELLLAGGAAEGGGRAAHVVDIALEARVMGQGGHLPDDALVAAAGDGPPLVEGQGAEVARPEAAPVMGDREAHLLDGRDAPHLVVHRVGLPDIGQLGHPVHLRRGQGGGGGIDDEEPVPVLLEDGPAHHCVMLQILRHVGPGIGGLVGGHLLKGGDFHLGIGAHAGMAGGHTGAPHVGDLLHRGAGGEAGQDLHRGPLPHAIGQDVRLGVKEDGAAHLVLPVVVVGEAAQAGLQAADDDGDVPKDLPHPVGVHHGGVVGAQPRPPSGGVGVVVAALFGGGVVGHHGVQVAGGNHHRQAGLPQGGEGRRGAPVGLGQDGHPIALVLQKTADDGGTEGGVVHVCVPGDDENVIIVPAPVGHVIPADWEEQIAVKAHGMPLSCLVWMWAWPDGGLTAGAGCPPRRRPG